MESRRPSSDAARAVAGGSRWGAAASRRGEAPAPAPRASARALADQTALGDREDWKMFAPLRRGEPITPHAKVVAVLKEHPVGATAAALANELLRIGAVLGTRATVVRRIGELLDELERTTRVERIPDGRYRVVKGRS